MKFLLALLIPLVAFCTDRVLVSIYPFYDLVKGIAGEGFETEVLIPPRADYHLYELTSKDLFKIAKARVVFVSGIPVGGWEEKVANLAKSKTVELVEKRNLKVHEEHGEVRFDPHVWLSPRRMMGVARRAHEGFVRFYPQNKDVFRKNLEEVLQKLKKLDEEYSRGLAKCRVRTVPVSHPALSYLAEDYGLEQISITSGGVHGGVSPREVERFVRKVKEAGVDFIFEVFGARSKVAEVLSREYGLRIYEFNAKIIPTETAGDYFSIMRENLEVLREALKCN
ncbi:MAG: zinc ABC transporter substrate-binding protein [Aquificae bacterium]|nr:zinc ABC transporter substrate-binding protein [Aquificota bacterium]